MRTEGQVRQQLKQVLFRHLQKKLKSAFKHVPESCIHNETMGKIGFCGLQSVGQRYFIVCDSTVVGCLDKAKGCPFWKSRGTKTELKAEFRALVEGDKGRLAIEHPDVAALLWVIGNSEGLAHDLDSFEGQPMDQSYSPTEIVGISDIAAAAEQDGVIL